MDFVTDAIVWVIVSVIVFGAIGFFLQWADGYIGINPPNKPR